MKPLRLMSAVFAVLPADVNWTQIKKPLSAFIRYGGSLFMEASKYATKITQLALVPEALLPQLLALARCRGKSTKNTSIAPF